MNETDFLWGMYQEHVTQGRHHENQRATVTNYIIIVAGGISAFIADNGIARYEWFLAAFIIMTGLFGVLFSAKQYQKFQFHMKVASHYRHRLETIINAELWNIRNDAKSEHEVEYPKLLVKLPLFSLWLTFQVLIVVLGIILLLMTLK